MRRARCSRETLLPAAPGPAGWGGEHRPAPPPARVPPRPLPARRRRRWALRAPRAPWRRRRRRRRPCGPSCGTCSWRTWRRGWAAASSPLWCSTRWTWSRSASQVRPGRGGCGPWGRGASAGAAGLSPRGRWGVCPRGRRPPQPEGRKGRPSCACTDPSGLPPCPGVFLRGIRPGEPAVCPQAGQRVLAGKPRGLE